MNEAVDRSAKCARKKYIRILNVIGLLFLCVSVLAATMGALLEPRFPDAGTSVAVTRLDPAWMYAITQAAALKLVFGKDILFTYGPYVSLWTGMYHPATDTLTLAVGLFFGLSYMAVCILLARGTRFYWLVMFGITLTFWVILRDVLFTSYPLLVALLVYRVTLPPDHARAVNLKYGWLLPLLFLPFGLLPLVKASFIFAAIPIAVLSCGLLVKADRFITAGLCILFPLMSCWFFWVLSGQPPAGLPDFFAGIMPIMSGYAEAMGIKITYSSAVEIGFFLLPALFLPPLLFKDHTVFLLSRLFLLTCYGIFLFLAFKSAFIRSEQFHELNAAAAIFVTALTIPFVLRHRLLNFLPVVLSLPWVLLQTTMLQAYVDTAGAGGKDQATIMGGNLTNSFTTSWSGLSQRLGQPDAMNRKFDEQREAVRKIYPIPPLPGTTDIYSYGQTYLLASDNHWSPRPVVQSYSVYTPWLLERDAQHLLGNSAPDTIFFSVEPIDDRLPSLEDGASWPLLMNNYDIADMNQDYPDHDYLVLKKKKNVPDSVLKSVLNKQPSFGETVPLPLADVPLYAQIDVTQSSGGKIVSALFKPSELRLIVTMADGTHKSFKIISGMIKTPFLISPLVQSTREFAAVMHGEKNIMKKKRVMSIEVRSGEGKGDGFGWNPSYKLIFSQSPLAATAP